MIKNGLLICDLGALSMKYSTAVEKDLQRSCSIDMWQWSVGMV